MHMFLLAATAAALFQGNDGPVPVLDQTALETRIDVLGAADTVTATLFGESRHRRGLFALELRRGATDDARPAILIVAGLTGPQAWTSGLALDIVERLAGSTLLDDTAVIVVPRLNPDACEARFASPLAEVRGTGAGLDDDRDGRQGEDPPADVNGDGFITWMRVPDLEGTWMPDPTDPRANVEADPLKGERGRWRLVREGRDLDGDDEASEDAPADAEVNRNFSARWDEHTLRGGRFPTDEPEARALCDLLVSRPDIQVVLVFGEQDNLVGDRKSVPDDAPATNRLPKAGLRKSDADRLERLAERWKKATGLKTADDASTDDAGTLQAYAYEHRGLLTLCSRPWSIPPADAKKSGGEPENEDEAASDADESTDESADEPDEDAGDDGDAEEAPEPSKEARRIAWLDEHGRGDAHLGWQPFGHPELGPVEIGGFRPYAASEPRLGDIEGLAAGAAKFLEGLGPDLARVGVADINATDLGGGLWDLHATVVNTGWLPLRSQWGERTRSVRLPAVRLEVPGGASLRAGRSRTSAGDLGGGARQEFRWLVSGALPGAIHLTVDTDHAGRVRTTFEEESQ